MTDQHKIERFAEPGAITRRGFHRLAAVSAAALVIPSRGASSNRMQATENLAYATGPDQRVTLASVARHADATATMQAVRRAALETTDFSWLSRGDSVLIKPVCNSGNTYPATTDPVALQAMISLLRQKGAGRVIVGDMSGVQFVRFDRDHLSGSTRRLMTGNGMAPACEAVGAEVHAFEEAGWDGFFDETPTRGDNWKQPLLLPKILSEVDHVVLMPRCSRHMLAGSTLGLKAAVGWWRHDSRLEYHHDAATFAQKTAESNTAPSLLAKQRLVLSSATQILTSFGPDEGYVSRPETGVIIASRNIVAHDMVSLAWLLHNRAAAPAAAVNGPIDDPYQAGTVVNFANRVVVGWLGGFGKAISAETLTRRDIDTVWDDRVIRHSFEVFDGVPRIDLLAGDNALPETLFNSLAEAVALPA